MNPIRSVYWKELVLQLWPAGRPARHMLLQWIPGLVAMIGMGAVFSVMAIPGDEIGPLTFLPILLFMFVAMLPSNIAMDGFAGERERNTLETVLAAPITPRQLLWGKLLAQLTILGGGMGIAIGILGVLFVSVDLSATELALLATMTPIMFVAALLMGSLTLIVGNLASIRSPNVKAAGPRAMGYMFAGMGIAIAPSMVLMPLLAILIGQDESMLTGLFLLTMVLAVLLFIGYLAYLFVQILRHTRSDRFQIEV